MLRTSLVTALKALPALAAANVTVDEIAQPSGALSLPMPAIGVCRPSGRAADVPEIGYHLNQPATVLFQLVVSCDDASHTIAAMQRAEQIGTDAMAVRNVDIGIYGTGEATDTGGVFMDYVTDDVMAFAGREGGAGPIALVISLRSTALPI